MIKFDETTNGFLLSGKNFSYAAHVNGEGCLQNLYFGKKIELEDLGYLISRGGNRASDADKIPFEYGGYGRGDYREPTIVAERKDGAAMSGFCYVSHKICDGVPEVQGLPHARSGGQTLSVTLKDYFSDILVILNYTVWEDSDVIVRNAEIVNTGKEPVTLKKAFSFCTELPEREYSVLRLYGSWAKERYPELTKLGRGVTRIQSLRGASSHQMNPFMGILCESCTENVGECYGVQLIYSGSFAITAEVNYNGTLRLQGGINDLNFGWKLCGGERLITPQAALCYSCEGLGGMSRAFADFLRERVINPNFVYMRRPIVVNNWEATYFDFDDEKLFSLIDEAAALGIDAFVLDDGWFGKRNDDTSSLGDWFVNTDKLKGGLKPVIERCKKNGLKFGLWFEPEMISEDSDLYRAHPDWAVKKEGVEPVRGRNQLVLDLTRGEVVEYVFNAVSEILTEHEISYVKWDFNRTLTEFYSARLPADRQGEFAHRYVLGFYDLAERLTAKFPNVFFEGCAGGGGRFDAGALYYFAQIWTSDDTDGLERTKIQWGTATCYPVSGMSCHVSACPNHQTQRTTPFQTRGAIASLGATGYELDLTKLTEEEKQNVKEQIKAYRQIDDLVLKGDLYRLSNPFESNYFCEMLVAKDKARAYVVGERFRGDPCDYDRILKLYGLDENKAYRITELNLTASGKALLNAGVFFPRLPDCGSWIWHIEEAK